MLLGDGMKTWRKAWFLPFRLGVRVLYQQLGFYAKSFRRLPAACNDSFPWILQRLCPVSRHL